MWEKHPKSPVLGKDEEKWFDVCVLPREHQYYFYISHRDSRTVMLVTSPDGISFGEPQPILPAPLNPLYHYNRACVVESPENGFLIYLTEQFNPPSFQNESFALNKSPLVSKINLYESFRYENHISF